MAEGPSIPATTRIVASYQRLAESAGTLNQVSDAFSKEVAVIEAALLRLNVGLEVWEKIRGAGDASGNYWSEHIGFTKWRGEWRIALRQVEGNDDAPEQEIDTWPFGEAPRSLRIEAVDKLPDLVDKLVVMADKTREKMLQKGGEVAALAKALTDATATLQVKHRGRS